MTDADSISQLLSRGPGTSNAIGAPDCTPLTYDGLRDLAARTIEDLNRIGIGRGDRVAFVLNNGPELAAAFVCIAA
ncbi:MAG: AMP-dependent synthetase, partial [Deltaproteobacteria bacterium]